VSGRRSTAQTGAFMGPSLISARQDICSIKHTMFKRCLDASPSIDGLIYSFS
jgi:hypothetical protein